MSEFSQQAKDKLAAEMKAGGFDRYGEIMKAGVRDALVSFAEQDDEFAQAIVQGGTLKECMKAVSAGCGQGISDLEAYQRAVTFYFPGAKVSFHMTVDLIGDAAEGKQAPEPERKAKILDIRDFL